MNSLHTQPLIHAPIDTKIRLAILSTALVDALGGPVEFRGRFSFPLVTTMIPNRTFGLQPGVWTDDTSMTLCLARSLATYKKTNDDSSERGGFNEEDQMEAYLSWYGRGVLSATGNCFDIGNTTRHALDTYADEQDPKEALKAIHKSLSADRCGGNGSLMRVVPIGLAYWKDESAVVEYGRRSSATTHPNELCMEVCAFWSSVIAKVMRENVKGGEFTKLDLLEYISAYPFQNSLLVKALTLPSALVGQIPKDSMIEREEYYRSHHPLLRIVIQTQSQSDTKPQPILPPVKDVPSSGYVFHTLTAALYCFFATKSFEEGAVMVVNLGDDADTVGAVYAGLAGTWYAHDANADKDSLFWSERVWEWRSDLVKRDLVMEVAEELVQFAARINKD
ncbi:ADP-ribosylglycohydrolase [Pluteus cervinus]|uniref:ADP-ribosylglycohydrolase n=1 Tax=Pluteus cervinus TaxID=181527 RepID=A0ACD3A962_9AGAR|nr:ADP-ribosylglycohydrolase [Pluteus cervinus]